MTTTEPRSTDPSRTGAVWVAGTGAFLLLAAAAVFVAVRWDDIGPSVKLAAVAASTGAFLVAGRRLRHELPATASALVHLGAFLVPVDVAAVGIRSGLGWEALLVVQGLVSGTAFALAARVERSVVLRWATVASVAVGAAGVGALGPVPAPLVLTGVAVAALVAGAERAAATWAATAGLAPVAALVLDATAVAPTALAQLGFTGHSLGVAPAATGLAGTGVLAVVARRHLDPALALLAATVAAVGFVATGSELDASPWAWIVGAAAVLAVVELAALLLRADRFWGPLTDQAATVGEAFAVPGTLGALGVTALAPLVLVESSPASVAAVLLAVVWAGADLRRRAGSTTPVAVAVLLGGRFPPATVGIGACIPAAVVLATGSGPLTGIAFLVTWAALLAGGRPWSPPSAVMAVVLAPLVVAGDANGPSAAVLAIAAGVGVAGSLLLARAVRWRTDLSAGGGGGILADHRWLLAAAAPVPLLVAASQVADRTGQQSATLAVATVLVWLVAGAADAGGAHRTTLTPSTLTRVVALGLVLAASSGLDPLATLVIAAATAALVVTDAVRLGQPPLAVGLAASLPVAIAAGARAAELTVPRTGVALTVAAVVAAGIGSLVASHWRLPVLASAASLSVSGLLLATGEPAALADAMLVVGGLLLAAGLATDRVDVATLGGAGVILGLWSRLGDAGVTTSEAYVAPVAALLLLVGSVHRRHEEATSWVTTGPAVVLLGGAALAERLAGGGGGHAVLAGAVGLAAVAAGGTWRLAAPLLLGTGLLVALAAHESLAVTAGVPTWGWLAFGGTVLLGTGIALERSQHGPLETGRRLVDVVAQRYR